MLLFVFVQIKSSMVKFYGASSSMQKIPQNLSAGIPELPLKIMLGPKSSGSEPLGKGR